jgi:hypothetical protein
MSKEEWKIPWELLPEKETVSRPMTINGKQVVHVIDGKRGHKLIVGKSDSPWHEWTEFIKFKGILVSPRSGEFKVSSLAE